MYNVVSVCLCVFSLSLFSLQFALLRFCRSFTPVWNARPLQSAAQRAPGSVSLCVLLPCEETCISVSVVVWFFG